MAEKIKVCAGCGKASTFTDQPADYAAKRWPGNDQPKTNRWTRCDKCGASFIVDFVDPSARKKVSE